MTKSIIQILILTLITIAAVVGFEVYHKSKVPVLPEIVEEQLSPVDPNLSEEILEQLKEKQKRSPAQEIPRLPF